MDPELPKLMRTLDASRLRVLRHVELPAALPGLFSGAKIAVAVAVIGAVFAEWAGSSSGLGHLIQQAIPQLETARAYAAVRDPVRVRDRAVRPAHAGRAPARAVGARPPRRNDPMKRLLPIAAALAALLALAALRREGGHDHRRREPASSR